MIIELFTIIIMVISVILIVTSIISKTKKSDDSPKPIIRKATERYYSYGKTITEGGVMPSCKNSMDSLVYIDNDSKVPTYKINYYPFNSKEYIDWDSSSGMLCGNSWGKPSEQAKVFYNLLSLNSDDSILYDMDKKTRRDFLGNIFYKELNNSYSLPVSSDWQANYFTKGPICNNTVWSSGLKYLNGFMGRLGKEVAGCLKNDEQIYWYHAGATYGYGSWSLFVPGSISGDFGGTILEGNDVSFVCSNNVDYDDVITQNAILYVCYRLTQNPFNFKSKKDLDNLLKEALYYSFNTGTNIAKVGMTPTLGYYYKDKQNVSQSGWATITLLYDNTQKLIQSNTNTLYPFKNGYLGNTIEPCYYFGSGTKPVTAMMVVNALYRAFKKNKVGDVNDVSAFRKWYTGPYMDKTETSPGGQSINSATMKDIIPLESSTYYETIGQYQNNPVTDTIQNLLTKYIYNSDACKYSSWAQHNEYNCPSTLGTCPTIDTSDFNNIFMNNVSVFDIASMTAGIPDSDTVTIKGTGLDTIDQQRERIHSFGPMEYMSELIGFDWKPGYYYNNMYYQPNTLGWNNYNYPPSSYTSSGFTLLGSFLWFLDYDDGKKMWWEIDINKSFLPSQLQTLINFGGTSGNGGDKYMINVGKSF